MTTTSSTAATGRPDVLVLGMGNEALKDEGLGAVAARRLARQPVPGVEVVIGSAPGLSLVEAIEDRECVLLLDAVAATDAPPGEVVVLRDDEVRTARDRLMSAGQTGVAEALEAATDSGRAPRKVAAVGMVPANVDSGVGLSEAVWVRLATLVSTARAMLREWQVKDA